MKAILALASICSLAVISIAQTNDMQGCTVKHSFDVCYSALNR